MTAGMNTRNLEAGRISLPRAGLGALLVGTLLAGSLLGAATDAAINMANANTVTQIAATAAAVREGEMANGNGPLAGDARGVVSATTGVKSSTEITAFPAARDGFESGREAAPPPAIAIPHAPDRGPLQ